MPIQLKHWRSVTVMGRAEHITEQADIDRVVEFVKTRNPALSPAINRTWIDAWGHAEEMALFGFRGHNCKFPFKQPLQAEIPLKLSLPTIGGESVSLSVLSSLVEEWQAVGSYKSPLLITHSAVPAGDNH